MAETVQERLRAIKDGHLLSLFSEAADLIDALIKERDEAREKSEKLELQLATGISEIKYDLNNLAILGAVPMWGSLIGRLDDLARALLSGGAKT